MPAGIDDTRVRWVHAECQTGLSQALQPGETIMSTTTLDVLHEALFASDLQSSQHPSAADIRSAIDRTLVTLGAAWCVDRVAQEFGDHPETAVIRMRWAAGAVATAYRWLHAVA
jgi:hypothetical protein